ncbi:P-loop NTPase family protein [Amycolatopsis alkalitolerans]|uniref:Uncharacterized protein n=1 Tax=Amycolatopsis alkalitolerans TaxID=2547244 RepID=A0A5C4MAS8_9PSEU|nr:hypothetical protein [Amycolatopsis alkalitolerans]TNC29121.1 hypothetical protein FG385_03200 [Amycolatopsis alkalitolerans]
MNAVAVARSSVPASISASPALAAQADPPVRLRARRQRIVRADAVGLRRFLVVGQPGITTPYVTHDQSEAPAVSDVITALSGVLPSPWLPRHH